MLRGKFGLIDTVLPRYIYIVPTIWPEKNGNVNIYKIGGKDFSYASGQKDQLLNRRVIDCQYPAFALTV